MRDIKRLLLEKHPQTGARLLPTLYTDLAEIPQNPALRAAFADINSCTALDSQYEWLARFCAAAGLEGIELALHRDEQAGRELISVRGAYHGAEMNPNTGRMKRLPVRGIHPLPFLFVTFYSPDQTRHAGHSQARRV